MLNLQKLYLDFSPKAKDWVDEQEIKILGSIETWFFCVALTIFFPLIVFVVSYSAEQAAQLAQRCGTIGMIFSIFAETQTVRAEKLIMVLDSNLFAIHKYIEGKYKSWVVPMQYATRTLILINTLITGFGEALYKQMFC